MPDADPPKPRRKPARSRTAKAKTVPAPAMPVGAAAVEERERWEAYAAGSRAEHFSWWANEYLEQSIDQFAGKPLSLEPWQRAFLDEALAVRDDMTPWWDSVVLVLPRGNGKTTLLAAYALYHVIHDDGSPEVLLAASSDKQAGRLFDAVVSFISRREELRDYFHIRHYVGEIARVDGRGKILRMASDPDRLHGYAPSLVVVDELHAWTKPNLRRAYAALTTAGAKRKSSQVFSITTAGEAHQRESSILGRILDQNEQRGELDQAEPGLRISRNHDARTLAYNYTAATNDPSDTDAIMHANPASWVTREYIERQAANPELGPAEFLQLHACVWTMARDAWIKRSTWDALEIEGLAPPDGATIWVGLDAALTDDCTALAWAWRLEAEPSSDGELVMPRIGIASHVWSAKQGNAAHETAADGRIDLRLVLEYLDQLALRYNVAELVVDPNRLGLLMEMASERGFVVADVWGLGAHRSKAWAEWYGAVIDGRVVHSGDRVLAEHICGAEAKMTERGWYVAKLRQNPRQKIDALVASAMAHWRARVNSSDRSVYEDRGLLTL